MSADRLRNGNRSSRCVAIQAQLFDYVDSTLDASAMQAVNLHFIECEGCRLEVEQIRRAEEALSSMSLSVPASGDLYAGFAQKLAARQAQTSFRRLRFVGPAFAVVILALVLVLPSFRRVPSATKTAFTPSPLQVDAYAVNKMRESHNPGAIALNGFEDFSKSVTLREHIGASARRRRSAGEHNIRLAFGRIEARKAAIARDRKQFSEQQLGMAEGLADSTDYELAKSTPNGFQKLQVPAVADLAYGEHDLSAAADATKLDRRSLDLSLEARLYTDRDSGPTAETGFALVVEDDVRGFTAEAHNAAATQDSPAQSKAAVNDGVKVEVEFDDASRNYLVLAPMLIVHSGRLRMQVDTL